MASMLYWINVAFMDIPKNIFLKRNLCAMLKEVICIFYAKGPNMKGKFATNLNLEAYQNHGMNCKEVLKTHFEVNKPSYQEFLVRNVFIIV